MHYEACCEDSNRALAKLPLVSQGAKLKNLYKQSSSLVCNGIVLPGSRHVDLHRSHWAAPPMPPSLSSPPSTGSRHHDRSKGVVEHVCGTQTVGDDHPVGERARVSHRSTYRICKIPV
ncbi:hypothetical protein GOODEAATRI_028859 [Goodea atripinnis]|uniref:Uncharacterized protein n=1 Tax=Goodea atripinnis TaxID=208336 RepID=A0ABV0N519_9TELE